MIPDLSIFAEAMVYPNSAGSNAIAFLDTLIDPDAPGRGTRRPFHIWTEGPVWIPERNALFFSDVPANRRYRWSTERGSRFSFAPGYEGMHPTAFASQARTD